MSGGEFFIQGLSIDRFIGKVLSVLEQEPGIRKRLASLRAPFQELLENQSWLP